jgi:hypothetical protein
MEDIKVHIKEPQIFKDGNDEKFVVYVINITVGTPYHRWEIIRRFSDFQNLFNFMTSKANRRHIDAEVPSLSMTKHMLSFVNPRAEAKKRIPKLQNYISGLLSLPDLTMCEIDILKTFLNYDEHEMFLDMERNSSVRLSEDFGVANTTNLDDITQVSRVLFQDNLERGERIVSSESGMTLEDRDSESGSTWRNVPGDDDKYCKGIVCITSTSSDSLTTVETKTSKSNSLTSLPETTVTSKQGQPPPLPYSISPDGKNRIYAITSDGLKEAVRNNDVRGVKELLKVNPKLAAYSDSGGNPIIYSAALYGSVGMAVLLIDAGADPYCVNRNGLCAFDIALEPWRNAVMEHMVKRKALIQNHEALVTISVKLLKSKYGLGIKLGRNPDGHALVVGFADMPKGYSNPAKSCIPPLEMCDIICSVNNMGSSSFETTVDGFKEAAVGDTVEIKVMRSLL